MVSLKDQGHSAADHEFEEHPHGETRGHPSHDEKEKNFKQGIFIALLAVFALILFFVLKTFSALLPNLWWIVIVVLILYFISSYGYLLQLADYERAVIFRLGKVNRVGGPGWALAFPPIEAYNVVDLRTKTLDIPKQEVVTKDNIEVTVDAVIYLKIDKDNQSVINSIIEVDDYLKASELFVSGLIRDKAGSMDLSELISNVEELNVVLKKELERLAKKWGVVVEEAVIQDIQIPKDVLDSMHAQKIAVQNKLARLERAEGHRAEIEAVMSAAEKLNDRALAYYYIKALGKLGESKSTKVIFPMELTNLATSLSGDKGLSSDALEGLFRKYAPLVKSLAQKEKKKGKKK